MKSLLKTTIAFVFTLTLSAGLLFGQTVQFDENGSIFINGAASPGGALMPDPSGGLSGNVLVYQLPFLVDSGDIGLLEAGATTNNPSDLVRFFTPSGANTSEIIFYSDIETTGTEHDLADTGLPAVGPYAFFASEIGPEGNNGLNFGSVNTAPGALPGGGAVIYDVISDAPVPEPAFGSLLLLGLATCLGLNRLRRNPCA